MKHWDIHPPSGHCRYISGADAYYDASTEHGKELPFVGPFGSLPDKTVLLALITELESLYSDRYVVLAELTSGETYETPGFSSMGVTSNWTPMYAFRTFLFADTRIAVSALKREWELIDATTIRHLSGTTFAHKSGCYVATCDSDCYISPEFIKAAQLAFSLLQPTPIDYPLASIG